MSDRDSARTIKKSKNAEKGKPLFVQIKQALQNQPWYSTSVDYTILIPLLLLIAFGILMVWSANMYSSVVEKAGIWSFLKQAVFVAVGIILMMLLSKVDYRIYNHVLFVSALVLLSFFLLLAVYFWGPEINNARRWFRAGVITFQPSEFAKLAGCLYMACIVTKKPQVRVKAWPMFKYCILPMVALFAVTYIEPSMSAAIAIVVPMAVILFLAVEKLRLLLPYFILGGAGAVGLLVATPWRMERLMVLLGRGTEDHQIYQSLLAIGSGGVFGKGLGKGLQKYLFLPELENDFIFANIGEETGMLGCLLVLTLITIIVIRGIKNAIKAPDGFGFYYTSGVMVLLAFQTIMHVGVAVGLIPVTGMALPFVSAGGSSIVGLLVMMGPVLNLSRQVQCKEGRKGDGL